MRAIREFRRCTGCRLHSGRECCSAGLLCSLYAASASSRMGRSLFRRANRANLHERRPRRHATSMADSQDSAHTETTSVGCLEFNYRYIGANAGSSGSVGPIIVQGPTRSNGDTVQYAVSVSSNAAIMLKDVLTARARAGWSYYLPYAFAGFAVGRADVSRITSVTGMKSTTTPAVFDAFGNVIVPPQTTTAALLLPRSPQSTSESTIVTDFHWASALTSAYYKTCSFGPSGNTRSFPTSTTFAST
jgi:hypothetical protein